MPNQLLSLSTSVLCHTNFSHYQPLFYAISSSLIINLCSMPHKFFSLSNSILCHINFSHYQSLFFAISTSLIINLCSMPYQLLSLSTSVLCHINFSHYQPLFFAISTSLIISLCSMPYQLLSLSTSFYAISTSLIQHLPSLYPISSLSLFASQFGSVPSRTVHNTNWCPSSGKVFSALCLHRN